MTKEEILEKHLAILIEEKIKTGPPDKYFISIEEIKKQPEWAAVLDAMEEYAIEKYLYI